MIHAQLLRQGVWSKPLYAEQKHDFCRVKLIRTQGSFEHSNRMIQGSLREVVADNQQTCEVASS
jgi:hypothetical protein